MITRCLNSNHESFRRYGAQGITVCDRWRDFSKFLADMGECPNGLSIDRIDGTKGYEPGNCRWATSTTQSRNQRDNRFITFNGETKCLSAWAECAGIKRETLIRRLSLKWPMEKALHEPVQRRSAAQRT